MGRIESNIIQAETYQIAPDKESHGYNGPLKVSYGGFVNPAGQELLDIAPQYDSTRGTTEDTNNFVECNKYAVSTFVLRYYLSI